MKRARRWHWPSRWPRLSRVRLRLGVALGVPLAVLLDYARSQLLDNLLRHLGLDQPWFLVVLLLLLLGAVSVRPPGRIVAELPHPSDLPPKVPGFVGRKQEIRRVRMAAGQWPAVAIVGERGVGTSALLSAAAHEVRGEYPDRQVYVDVRGGHRHPLNREQVLGRVCHKLGMPVPATKDDDDLTFSADWLRNHLRAKRMLLVLDNVDDPGLVVELLPETGHSLVLLAGTPLLASRVAHCVRVEALSDDDAVELLHQDDAPQEFTADLDSAVRLVRQCGRQPLAIRLVRARLKRDHSLAARSFRDAVAKAVPPDGGEPDAALRRLQIICDLAYLRLSEPAQRMFRLLALVPATEIGLPAAAALAGLDETRAGEALAELAGLEFVESVSDSRYRLRHLLGTCARDQMLAAESPGARWRALSRLAGYLVVVSGQQADALGLAEREGQRDRAVSRGQADEWFGWEHDLLYGMVTDWLTEGPDRLPIRVQRKLFDTATALCLWYSKESRLLADRQRVCETVRRSRLAHQDRSVAGWVHNELAVMHRLRADPPAASRELTAGLGLLPYRNRAARTQAMINLGLVQIDQRHVQESIGTLEAARRLRGDRYGQALTDVALSAAHLYGDNPLLARLHADRCLSRVSNHDDTFTTSDVGELRVVAAALNNLGLALWRQGDHLGAAEQWDDAYKIYDDLDDDAGLARVTLNQAAMLLAQKPELADDAIAGLEESLRLRGAGCPTVGTGLCHLNLGHAYARKAALSRACDEWRLAWGVFTRLGVQPEADEARRLLEQHNCADLPPPTSTRPPGPPPGPTGWRARVSSWWARLWAGP